MSLIEIAMGGEEITEPSTKSGVYFLWDASGNLLYVGESKNVESRIVEHQRIGAQAFARATWLPVVGFDRKRIEQALIRALAPERNVAFRRANPSQCAADERLLRQWVGGQAHFAFDDSRYKARRRLSLSSAVARASEGGPEDLLTGKEVADLIGSNYNAWRRRRHRARIHSHLAASIPRQVQIGGRFFYRRRDVLEWLRGVANRTHGLERAA